MVGYINNKGILKRELFVVFLIFLSICIVRLFLALSVEGFSSDNSYYVLRQVEHISTFGTPIIHDDLSYMGRTYFVLPVFYYVLAFFDLFLPIDLVCKIIPNIVAPIGIFIVYFIGVEITKNKDAALFTSFMSGIVPVFLSETVYSVSVYSFVIPLFLLLIFCLIKLSKLDDLRDAKEVRFYKILYFVFFILLSFLHQSVILFVLFLWVYFLVSFVEGSKVTNSEIELTLFSSFFVIWFFLITMKPLFLEYGASVIFGGVPHFIRYYFFTNFTLLESMYKLGIIPVLYGLYSLFRFTFGKQEKYVYMLVSLIYLMLVLLWFRVISFNLGLIFLGNFLMIVILLHYDFLFEFFNFKKNNKSFAFLKVVFVSYYILSFIISSVFPSLTYLGLEKEKIPTTDEIYIFQYMKQNIPNGSVVVAIPDYGQKIAYFSNKKTIMDSYYFGVKESSRLIDLEKMYTTSSLSTATPLFDKYGADYILISSKTKLAYNSTFPSYVDSKCFDLITQKNDVFLFKLKCKVVTFET